MGMGCGRGRCVVLTVAKHRNVAMKNFLLEGRKVEKNNVSIILILFLVINTILVNINLNYDMRL
jgi:hypothetical protein